MEDFYNTITGKIINLTVHDHIHGIGRINRSVKLIKRNFDSLSKEEIFKKLDFILEGSEKCVKAVDYSYTKLKEIHENKDS